MERYLEFILNHYLLALGLAVVTFLLIQDVVESLLRKYAFISPAMLVAKMNTETVAVLDVRDQAEFNKGHIENAQHIPLDKLAEQLSKLTAPKDQPLVVTCETGARATSACKLLTQNGFSQVSCLTGGMEAWEDSKLPIKVTRKNKT